MGIRVGHKSLGETQKGFRRGSYAGLTAGDNSRIVVSAGAWDSQKEDAVQLLPIDIAFVRVCYRVWTSFVQRIRQSIECRADKTPHPR